MAPQRWTLDEETAYQAGVLHAAMDWAETQTTGRAKHADVLRFVAGEMTRQYMDGDKIRGGLCQEILRNAGVELPAAQSQRQAARATELRPLEQRSKTSKPPKRAKIGQK